MFILCLASKHYIYNIIPISITFSNTNKSKDNQYVNFNML